MVSKNDKIDIILNDRKYAPEIIQTQLLNDIAGIMYEQLMVSKDAIPEIIKKYQFSVTDVVLELNEDKILTLPWISMTVYNDAGADPVHIFVNEYNSEFTNYISPTPIDPPLAGGDSFQLDMRASKIKKLYLVCDTGGTATVRIFASAKKYRSQYREELPPTQ
jgi:hypothetical protein